MVVLNRIYTRTGDAGETALGDGSRVPKDAPRVEATAPSTSSTPRSASPGCTPPASRRGAGADPERPLRPRRRPLHPGFEADADAPRPRLRIVAAQVDRLEAEIDADERRPRAAPQLRAARRHAARRAPHLARTVCRRAERLTVALAGASR